MATSLNRPTKECHINNLRQISTTCENLMKIGSADLEVIGLQGIIKNKSAAHTRHMDELNERQETQLLLAWPTVLPQS